MSSGKMKGYNVLNDRQNFLDKPVKNNIRTYNNIRKIATGQEDDETTNCSLFCRYFNENYKMIGLDLSKQGALDAGLKAIQQIIFTASLDRAGNTTVLFITEEARENILDFSQATVTSL